MNRLFLLLVILFVTTSCGQTPNEKTKATAESTESNEVPITQNVIENHPNGVLKIKGQNVDGKRDGHWESFFENGYKWSEVEYKMGAKSGPVVVFYENGMMRYQGRYLDDARSGVWTFYDTNGIVVKQINMDEVRMNPDSLLNP